MSIERKDASGLAYQIQGLLRACICADDTTVNVDAVFNGCDGIYLTLEVAEKLMGELIDLCEEMERGRGAGQNAVV